MADLFEPLHTKNPFRWVAEWTRAADGKAELNENIRERLEQNGNLQFWSELPTLRDVVSAWCGRLPTD